jgi:hypothetical protein
MHLAAAAAEAAGAKASVSAAMPRPVLLQLSRGCAVCALQRTGRPCHNHRCFGCNIGIT